MSKIKVRSRTGKVYRVKDAAFIEVCNDEDKLACLIYMTPEGMVNICQQGDAEFSRYLSMYKGVGLRPMTVHIPEVKKKRGGEAG